MKARTQSSQTSPPDTAAMASTAATLPPETRPPHAVVAEQYALDIIAGRIPAGKWARQCAQRHLSDLKKIQEPSYPYYFDEEKGAVVCEFIECLPHTKGKWAAAKQKIKLQPWQCFILVVLFGWIRERDDKRRFRTAYLAIPRKNGKSILAAGIGLYMLLIDGEFGAEVYSGATTEKQAWEVFGPARLMLERTPDLCEALGCEVWSKNLCVPRNGSKFQPVIGNPGDGPSPSCAIIDEFHEHDTPNLHDTMETGMGAREQPLMLIITTAGYNIAGPCYEKQDEVQKVLDGTVINEELFGCIYSIDEKDDWADPKNLIKANPNYGVSVDEEFLQSQQRQAMANPVQQSKFKTKHLNIWCSVARSWMNMQMWNTAADVNLDEDELIASDCERIIAIDLASKSDLCTAQRLYFKRINNLVHYYLFGRYWLPEHAVEDPGPNHAHYKKWVKMSLLTQTDGATIDFNIITDQVLEDAKRINPKEVVYDPFNATQMAQTLTNSEQKVLTVEFTQNAPNFALPMDEVVAALKDGRFHHDGNEITRWCMSNVVARPARKGLFAPMKQKDHQKIDGAVAIIMAVARAIAVKEKEREYQMIT